METSLMYLNKAYDHYKETLGLNHHRSADISVALGRHFSRTGDNKEAL
jgi:hypothetical protein